MTTYHKRLGQERCRSLRYHLQNIINGEEWSEIVLTEPNQSKSGLYFLKVTDLQRAIRTTIKLYIDDNDDIVHDYTII